MLCAVLALLCAKPLKRHCGEKDEQIKVSGLRTLRLVGGNQYKNIIAVQFSQKEISQLSHK